MKKLSLKYQLSFLALLALAASASMGGGVLSANESSATESTGPVDVEVAMVEAQIPADVLAWPRWRGPSGQGMVQDAFVDQYVDTWSQVEYVLWRVEVPGKG